MTLRKVGRPPTQTILEPVTATLAPSLPVLNQSSSPDAGVPGCQSVTWLTPSPGQPQAVGCVPAAFPHSSGPGAPEAKAQGCACLWGEVPSSQVRMCGWG